MNLDDAVHFKDLDPQNMLDQIGDLPAQLETAYQHGLGKPLPQIQNLRQIVIPSMGGSAIGADLVAAFAAPTCPVPVTVHREYGLPAWARGPETLVIALSHSGNTEEVISAFEAGLQNGCNLLAMGTGGRLGEAARQRGVLFWQFEHVGQQRAAVGYLFALLLALFARLGIVADPRAELAGAAAAMRAQMPALLADVPAVHNPAKRMAGQLVGRWVNVFGSDFMAPVARRWKTQICEMAKAWAQFELLPEADHNTLAGAANPADSIAHMMALFLRAPSDHPRNQLRSTLTRQSLMMEGINTDFIDARGDSSLAHMWTALQMGDYVSYYLAMAYEVDPTPVYAVRSFKEGMGM